MSEIIIDSEGTKRWYLAERLHRVDGPAIEWLNGTKKWWLNGRLHREGGPAIEYANGDKEWWINGKSLTKEEWLYSSSSEDKVKYLFIENFILE